MHEITAEWALLEDGFAPDVRIAIDGGAIVSVTPHATAAADSEHVPGVMLPGMPDLHSHAFQRVFAGQTNWTGGGGDFWTWREAMYRAAGAMTPERYAPVCAWLCKELLKGGFTSLTEFHYLQHRPGGGRYAPVAAMAEAVQAGAAAACMPLTLLVGVYETGGFGGEALAGGQLRFDAGAEDALAIAGVLQTRAHPDFVVGLAPHSLRAVPPATLARAVTSFRAAHAGPIHIHVAEQTAEVQDCVRNRGAPPVQWLLDHAPVDAGWCLIHATHATPSELAAVARRGAVIGLCPSTEADLGDGIFNFTDSQAAGNSFGLGTDSNTALDAFGEIRLLEYAQRLHRRRRNVAAVSVPHTGRALWQAAARGGAQASGRAAGRIGAGCRADFVTISATAETGSMAPDFVLDAAIFAAPRCQVRHVMASGAWLVRDGQHCRESAIDAAYAGAVHALRAAA